MEKKQNFEYKSLDFISFLRHIAVSFLKRGILLKLKTHSGAKKRFRAKPGGAIKRKKKNLRHLLINKSSKRKRHLGILTYVSKSNKRTVEELLALR